MLGFVLFQQFNQKRCIITRFRPILSQLRLINFFARTFLVLFQENFHSIFIMWNRRLEIMFCDYQAKCMWWWKHLMFTVWCFDYSDMIQFRRRYDSISLLWKLRILFRRMDFIESIDCGQGIQNKHLPQLNYCLVFVVFYFKKFPFCISPTTHYSITVVYTVTLCHNALTVCEDSFFSHFNWKTMHEKDMSHISSVSHFRHYPMSLWHDYRVFAKIHIYLYCQLVVQHI